MRWTRYPVRLKPHINHVCLLFVHKHVFTTGGCCATTWSQDHWMQKRQGRNLSYYSRVMNSSSEVLCKDSLHFCYLYISRVSFYRFGWGQIKRSPGLSSFFSAEGQRFNFSDHQNILTSGALFGQTGLFCCPYPIQNYIRVSEFNHFFSMLQNNSRRNMVIFLLGWAWISYISESHLYTSRLPGPALIVSLFVSHVSFLSATSLWRHTSGIVTLKWWRSFYTVAW